MAGKKIKLKDEDVDVTDDYYALCMVIRELTQVLSRRGK